MLPNSLLPSGQLAAMRGKAQEFMVHDVQVLVPTFSYDNYGTQQVTTVTTYSGGAYFGALNGKDKDLFVSLQQLRGERVGNETRYGALCLMPFETEVNTNDIIANNGILWRVIWCHNDTMDAVQIYTKVILEKIEDTDKTEEYSAAAVTITDTLLTELGYAIETESGEVITT